jgi:hypothetical protein
MFGIGFKASAYVYVKGVGRIAGKLALSGAGAQPAYQGIVRLIIKTFFWYSQGFSHTRSTISQGATVLVEEVSAHKQRSFSFKLR